MPDYYIVNSVNQFQPFESDVCRSLLKVFNDKHFVFIVLFTLNRPDMLIQTNYDIFPVVGSGDATEEMQHPFQVGNPVSLWSGDKMKSPPAPSHQIVDDNFTAKFTGRVGFIIPAQSPEDVDHPSLKHLILILVQLFKCAQNVRFADFRKIIVLQ